MDIATTMLAAQFEACGGEITICTVKKPICPADGVVVHVEATGVCRSDWHGWMGHDGDIISWFENHPGQKFTPGHELAGIVVETSKDCRFNVGDRVAIPFILSCGKCMQCSKGRATVCLAQEQPGFTFPGSYAEFVAIPRADRNLMILPDGVSFIEAASLGCRFTTAFRAVVQQGKLKAGQRVAVVGCGGVGLAACMIALACGAAEVYAFDVNKEALDYVEELFPTVSIGSSQDADFDLCIECSGFASGCEQAVKLLRPGGRMVQAGLCLGKEQPQPDMGYVCAKEIEIVGSHGFDGANDMRVILQMVEQKKLCPGKLIEKTVSLEEGVKILVNMSCGSPKGVVMITKF